MMIYKKHLTKDDKKHFVPWYQTRWKKYNKALKKLFYINREYQIINRWNIK